MGSNSGDLFDVRKVRRLVELMNEHDLSELDLKQGDQRIRIRKGHEPVMIAGTMPIASSAAAPASTGRPAEPAAPSSATESANQMVIKSPMVGTFYAAANPDAPPFVRVGDQVSRDTTVCIIEAMKVFNEIPAECTGRIVAVLVESGDAVEFGQPLFKVEK
jgi:acetyl-CoA carboxylase biotin carboxyl carrier protein